MILLIIIDTLPTFCYNSSNSFAHPVSHKSSLNFDRSCFPTTLSNSVRYYLEIIEASLLYIQAKTFADNQRCVFHFSEFNASDFLVKKIWKKWTIWTKTSKGLGF